MKKLHTLKQISFCLLLILLTVVGFSQSSKNKTNKKPLVVFVAGDHEYGGESTLPIIAAELEKNYGFRTKILKSFPDQNAEENIPGLPHLRKQTSQFFFFAGAGFPRIKFNLLKII